MAVALALRQLSILRVGKKTIKWKHLLNAQDVASICSLRILFSPFCVFFCFLFTQPIFTNLGPLSYPADMTCNWNKNVTRTLRWRNPRRNSPEYSLQGLTSCTHHPPLPAKAPGPKPAQPRLLAKGWDRGNKAQSLGCSPGPGPPCTGQIEEAHLPPFHRNALGRGDKQHPPGPSETYFPYLKPRPLRALNAF